MRRLTSVFSSKRDKKVIQQPTQPIPLLVAPPVHQQPPSPAAQSPCSSSFSTPILSSASDPSHSSGSSSGSASLSIQTPDEDQSHQLSRNTSKRSWKSWLGTKRSAAIKRREESVQEWHSLPPPLSHLPPSPLPSIHQRNNPEDVDDDVYSSSSDYPHTSSPEPIISLHSNSHPSQSPASARINIKILITNSLVIPLPVPPFLQHAHGPVYPRSSNPPRVLTRQSSLRVVTLNKILLTRLSDLSPSEQQSILPFAQRQTPNAIPPSSIPEYNISRPHHSTKIFPSSPGLRRWISRSCFEDRYIVFSPSDKGIDSRPVAGSSFAVAALEYSETLDVMIDPDFDQVNSTVKSKPSNEFWQIPEIPSPSIEQLPVPTAASSPSIELSQSSAPHTRNSYIAVPSPLRNEHSPSFASPPSSPMKQPPLETRRSSPAKLSSLGQDDNLAPKKPVAAVTSVKRVVRFAEEDDDDGIPLHIIRLKKKREERANFLRIEQQRRTQQEEAERRQIEAEAVENERKRLAREKERQERDRRLYAEQVSASRFRSEQSRAGAFALNSNSSTNLLVPPLATSSSSRELQRNLPRDSSGKYSPRPRKESSDSAYITMSLSHSPNRHLYDSSSGSSRPPSLIHSPAPGGQGNRSRPASTYSAHTQSSSEEARPSPASRRNSLAASATGSSRSFAAPYPTWSGSSHNVPPAPFVPNFASYAAVNDMPLLPPAAPFMKQYPSRQSSPGSDSPSRSGSKERSPSAIPHRNSSSSLHKEKLSSPPSSSSPHRTEFQSSYNRRTSGESRTTTHSSHYQGNRRPQPHPVQSYPQVQRGRAPIPAYHQSSQYLQAPSPWTAMPSRTGSLPTAMPVSPYTHTGVPMARGGGGSSGGNGNGGGFGSGMGHDWRSSLIS